MISKEKKGKNKGGINCAKNCAFVHFILNNNKKPYKIRV